ncbi:MAG: zinc metalloprotease HtpX [Alphaproteobacteria bacterium]
MSRFTVHRLRNLLHSVVLVSGMLLIAAACGWLILGVAGAVWALALVAAAALITPLMPGELALALYGARRLSPQEFPDGYALLREIAGRAGLPAVPHLYYIPSTVLNAFTVGSPSSASIALTHGMIRALSIRELAGVLAHEVSHVVHRDLWIMGLADAMSRVTAILSWFGMFLLIFSLPLMLLGLAPVPWGLVLVLVFAPTVMSLLQLALSRAREYEADLGAVRLTGDPRGLASALAKIERRQGRFWEEIVYPGRRIPDPSLLRSHPPTEERVERLLQIEPETGGVAPPGEGRRPGLPETVMVVPRPPRLRWWGGWY